MILHAAFLCVFVFSTTSQVDSFTALSYFGFAALNTG